MLNIESNVPMTGRYRPVGGGKSPEYIVGTEAYEKMAIGESAIIPSNCNPKYVRMRLIRLTEQNREDGKIDKEFSIRTQCIRENGEVVRQHRIFRTA